MTYNPRWVLACSMIRFRSFLFIALSLQFLTLSVPKFSSTWSLNQALGLPVSSSSRCLVEYLLWGSISSVPSRWQASLICGSSNIRFCVEAVEFENIMPAPFRSPAHLYVYDEVSFVQSCPAILHHPCF